MCYLVVSESAGADQGSDQQRRLLTSAVRLALQEQTAQRTLETTVSQPTTSLLMSACIGLLQIGGTWSALTAVHRQACPPRGVHPVCLSSASRTFHPHSAPAMHRRSLT